MGIIDLKLVEIKSKIKKMNIGFNREEKKLIIEALDQSKHYHYHTEIGLPPETILTLSDEEIGRYIKHQTFLNIKAACKDKPEDMAKYLIMYDTTAVITGASLLTAKVHPITPVTYVDNVDMMTPMPSGDFVEKLPGVIEVISSPEFITVGGEKVKIEIEQIKEGKSIKD